MDVISFIIPNRGGIDLDKTIDNINTVYAALNKEIIVVHQNDNRPFMRGQCYNIGFEYSVGNYLALTDNDIYHLRCLPLYKIHKVYQCPVIGFQAITQLSIKDGKVIYGVTEERPLGFGAFTFLSKNEFALANGFSNLYIGWGAEDRDFIARFATYIRVPQNLGHLEHPRRVNTNEYNTMLNHSYLKTASTRDKILDGLRQTRWTEDNVIRNGNVLNVYVSNITVNDKFKYIDMLEKHYSKCN